MGTGIDILDNIQRGYSADKIFASATLTTAKNVGIIYLNKGIVYITTTVGSAVSPAGAVVGYMVGVVICLYIDVNISGQLDEVIDKAIN